MKILGLDYTIAYKQQKEMDSVGLMNPMTLQITISADADIQMKISILLHEIIEGVNSRLELGMKESQIVGLEAGLYSVLKENGIDISSLLPENK